MSKERDNSAHSAKTAVGRLETLLEKMPEIDGKKITSLQDARADKVCFNDVMSYFCANIRQKNGKLYKNGSLKTMSDAIFRKVK